MLKSGTPKPRLGLGGSKGGMNWAYASSSADAAAILRKPTLYGLLGSLGFRGSGRRV